MVSKWLTDWHFAKKVVGTAQFLFCHTSYFGIFLLCISFRYGLIVLKKHSSSQAKKQFGLFFVTPHILVFLLCISFRYGLIVPKKHSSLQAKKTSMLKPRLAAFNNDDDSSDDGQKYINSQIHKEAMKKIVKKQVIMFFLICM